MKFSESLHFSETKYRQRISNKQFAHADLAREIYRKRAKKLSSKVHAIFGVIVAVSTGGGALIGPVWSGRNIAVLSQKIQLLEEEWHSRGHHPLPENKIKDRFIPVVIAIGTSFISIGIDTSGVMDQALQLLPDMTVDANGYDLSSGFLISASPMLHQVLDEKIDDSEKNMINKVVSRVPEQYASLDYSSKK